MPGTPPTNILIFDSGVGGLSICQKLIECAPALRLHYLSDNAAFPYGKKSEQFLIDRANHVINAALQKIDADIIVIACNTASTVVLPSLRNRLNIPVVGVVPAIKTAAEFTKTGVFGLLATPGTVQRSYTRELIATFASDKTVIAIGSNELVELAENYLYSGEICKVTLQSIVEQFDEYHQSRNIDYMVLGCTHFPLIKAQLTELRPQWNWVDSGTAIANRVISLLGDNWLLSPSTVKLEHKAWFTDISNETARLQDFLESHQFRQSQLLRTDK